MTVRAVGANSKVLKWARETAGLSVEDVAKSLGRPVEEVRMWEEGKTLPIFSQLVKLASSYRRPVAVFFFPIPPKEEDFQEEFRTLPKEQFDALHPDTRLALREAKAFQVSLFELSPSAQGRPLLTKEIQGGSFSSPALLARETRRQLGITLDDQRKVGGTVEAFKAWRDAVETAGIYVFKRPFEQESISGFCLHDEDFPIIMINNGTAHTRQSFTLFHELAHLLYGFSGITTSKASSEQDLSGNAKQVEIKCNQFAAEVLLPEESIPWGLFDSADIVEACERVASEFNISREVVLRKLRDADRVDQETYEELAEQWIREAQAARKSASSGGNYYANQLTYLGNAFTSLGLDQLRAGRIEVSDLADHFGMKASTLTKFERYVLERKMT